MAISKQAERVKTEMSAVVQLQKELAALEAEWQDLLYLEDGGGEERLAWLQSLHAERTALRKRLAAAQLHNWARLQHTLMTDLQRRILRLRYIQGTPWSAVIVRVGKTKSYLLREHNKALERLGADAAGYEKKREKRLEGDSQTCDKIA